MAANAISGPHGRDISAAESALSVPQPNPPLDTLSFGDVLDALNPLQYVPVVGTIYRAATGDQGSPGLRIAVSMVTGMLSGPVGLLTSIVGAIAEHFEEGARALVAPPGQVAAAHPAAPEASAPTRQPPVPAGPSALSGGVSPAVARRAAVAYARTEAASDRLVWGGRER